MKLSKIIRNKLFAILHSGDKYYCLYCEKSHGKFLHEGVKADVFKKYKVSGGGYKENTRCPNCGSVDRARLLALFFKLRTEVFNKPSKILHISPNKMVADYLNKSNYAEQIIGALEPDQFAEYSPLEMDVQKIELEGNVFDVVICCHVLEHVDKDARAMSEIHRVLKPGGFAVLQVPLALDLKTTLEDKTLKTDKERKKAHGQVDHWRLYGIDYLEKLNKAGFRVLRDNPYQNEWMTKPEIEKHLLDKIEDVIVAYKD